MIDDLKVLAVIPARGGSKGIKDKNIYPLCSKPLIAYTIEAAGESKYVDRTIVSTDSERIAEVSKEYGAEVPFMRPESLAADNSKTIDVIMHVKDWTVKEGDLYDVLVLLQPTQPLRTAEDIDKALETFMDNDREALVSVCEVDDNPVLIRRIEDNRLHAILNTQSTVRRQDMDKYYKVNGCIYINNMAEISENTSFNDNPVPFIMPSERSVDIDEKKDIKIAELYIEGKI